MVKSSKLIITAVAVASSIKKNLVNGVEVLEVFHVATPRTRCSVQHSKARQKRFRTTRVLYLLLNELNSGEVILGDT